MSVGKSAAAGIVWIAAIQFFIAQAVVQWQWTTPYSLSTNFISDLGNTACGVYVGSGEYVCSPWHALMNASFMLQGAIIAVGSALAYPMLDKGWARDVVGSLLGITALGMVGVGAFPENVDHAGHVISAGTQFITGNTAMLVLGLATRQRNAWRSYAVFSMCLGIAGLTATALFVEGYGLGLGVGGMERVAAYTVPVWLITSGTLLLRGRAA